MLFKRPGFALVAILTLALGVGANTVIFSGVYALLLQALPYPNAGRTVVLSQTDKQGVEFGISYPDFSDWSRQNTVFEQTAATKTLSVNLSEHGLADGQSAERATGSYVSQDFFPLMGGRAHLGRAFLPDDFRPGAGRIIVLSYGFWQRRFGGDASIIGKQLRIDNQRLTVIGVMPLSFQYPFRASFWAPLEPHESAEILGDRNANVLEIIAVLKPGATIDRANAELALLSERSARQSSVGGRELTARATGLRETMPGVSKYRTSLLVLQCAVAFVLLIASVNLANLLLARNAERRQEFIIRLALGAGSGRLIRQLLVESMLIGFLGCVLGTIMAVWGLNALRAFIPWRIPGAAEVEINAPVLLITLAISLITSIGFGLAPALMAARQDLNESLKSGAGSAGNDPGKRRLSGALVVAETALAIVLLASAGLMIRTFLNLTKENPGFNPENAVALSLSFPPSRDSNYENLSARFGDVISRIKSLPGVESVGGVTYLPLIGYNPGINFTIEGRAIPFPESTPRADFQPITPDYFQAIGIPLLGGRRLNDADLKSNPESVVVNNALAKKFWPGEDPIGKQIQLQGHDLSGSSLTIVGVVGDVKQFGLHTEPRPEIYLPMYRDSMNLIIRTSTTPGLLFPALREIIQKTDAGGSAAYTLKTMEQVTTDSIERRRIFAMLLGGLALIALILAVMGIYGVISYLISQRTREIGLRMALGAGPSDVLILIIGEGMKMVLRGAAIGLIASVALTRAMKSLLFGVAAADPFTFASTALLLTVAAFIACFLPARRAMKINPIVALRHD